MIKNISTFVIAAIAMASFTLTTPAHSKSFFDIFSKEEAPKGPPPEVTLQAPFPTTPDTKTSSGKLMDMYGTSEQAINDTNDLSKAHRNEAQIIEWSTEMVTQAMTIDLKTYDTDFKKISPYFQPYALKEYQDYLQKTNMMAVLSSNSYRLQTVSDEEGAVIKDGEIGGTYHWLVQIPLMASYYKEDTQSVDKTSTVQSQSLLVQVQVGRVAPKNSTDIGLTIERWSVSSYSKQ